MNICGYDNCEQIDLDTFNYHVEYGELEHTIMSPTVIFYDNGMGHGVFEVLNEGVVEYYTNVGVE